MGLKYFIINLLVFLISRDLSFELIRVVTETQLNFKRRSPTYNKLNNQRVTTLSS